MDPSFSIDQSDTILKLETVNKKAVTVPQCQEH